VSVSEYLHGFYLPSGIWQIALFLFISPILEEIVFRGLLQDLLIKKIANKFIAFSILNLGFMLAHVHVQHDVVYLLLIFICGVLYSLIKDYFLFLRYPIMVHICFNGIFLWKIY
jgi:membrane protease YdiL (CAAX protease family)